MESTRPRGVGQRLALAGRHKLLLVISALVCTGSVWTALSNVPQVYESRVELSVQLLPGALAPAPEDRAHSIESLRQRLLSCGVIQRERAKTGRNEDPDGASASVSLRVERTGASNLLPQGAESASGGLVISFRDRDPNVAREVASALGAFLVAQGETEQDPGNTTAQARSLRESEQQLAEQMRAIEARYPWLLSAGDSDTSVGQMPAVAQQPPAPSMGERLARQSRLESLNDKQFLLQQQVADFDKRISAQRQIVEQQKKTPQLRDSATYAALVARRTELQGQRDTLINRKELTDKHPRVVAIDDQINSINRQIEDLRKQEASAIRQTAEARELASLELERNRLALELEVNSREISRATAGITIAQSARLAPQGYRDRSPILASYLSLRRKYSDVSAKLETETKSRQLLSNLWKYELVQAAAKPDAPVGPSRWLFIAISATVGLLAGAAGSFALEWRRFRFVQDVRDAEYYGRMQLLGEIPRLATHDERKRALQAAGVRLVAGAVASILAAVAITKLLSETKLFELLSNNWPQ